MSAESKRRYTLEEYLALERESDARQEFWNGEIFIMSGGTLAHDRVMRNAFDVLHARLSAKSCEVFSSNIYSKRDDGSWSYSEVNELDAEVRIPSLDVSLAEIYRDVEFD
ncbi:MAG TPA: Uma2 family endonuclease [Blastocatellia bacterium]|nr:Uma2 family endonuclease [Blastocatellia bacterium]